MSRTEASKRRCARPRSTPVSAPTWSCLPPLRAAGSCSRALPKTSNVWVQEACSASAWCADMCGLFGVRSPGRDVARLTYFGLFALQHRGQESAGIAVSDEGRLTALRDMGLVTQVFD